MLMLLLCWFLRHPNKLRAGSLYWKFLSKILTIINWVGRYKLSCKNILLGKWDNKLTVIVFILPICIRLGQRFWRNSIGEYLMIMSGNSSEPSQVIKMLITLTDLYFFFINIRRYWTVPSTVTLPSEEQAGTLMLTMWLGKLL